MMSSMGGSTPSLPPSKTISTISKPPPVVNRPEVIGSSSHSKKITKITKMSDNVLVFTHL